MGSVGNLAATEISPDRLMAVKEKLNCGIQACQVVDAPGRCAGFSQNPVFMQLLERPFFRGQQNQ